MAGPGLLHDLGVGVLRQNEISEVRPQPRENIGLGSAASRRGAGWQEMREKTAALCHLDGFSRFKPAGYARKGVSQVADGGRFHCDTTVSRYKRVRKRGAAR